MKHFRLILIPCLVLEAIGVLVFVSLVPLEIHNNEVVSLASGADSIGHFVIDTEGGGSVTGTYLSDSGREVLIMILDDEQYEDYEAGRPHNSQLSVVASSGDFSLDRPAEEVFHVVIEHAVEPDQPEQVTLEYTVHSMDWEMTLLGTVLVFGSAFILAGAMIKHAKDKAAVRGPISTYADVVFFDEVPKK